MFRGEIFRDAFDALRANKVKAFLAVLNVVIGIGIAVLIEPLLPGNLTVPISGISIAMAFVVSCFTGVLLGFLAGQSRGQAAADGIITL